MMMYWKTPMGINLCC